MVDDGSERLSRRTLAVIDVAAFLSVADAFVPAPQKLEPIEALLAAGTKFTSLPALIFENDGNGSGRVVGHEGRHRAVAFSRRGIGTMPVVLQSNGSDKGPPIRWGQALPAPFPAVLFGQGEHRWFSIPLPESLTWPWRQRLSLPETLYHGTARSRLESIRRHGLDPRHGRRNYPLSAPDTVYLADTPAVAVDYAYTAMTPCDHDEIVVLSIDSGSLAGLRPDANHDPRAAGLVGSCYANAGPVPAAAIVAELSWHMAEELCPPPGS